MATILFVTGDLVFSSRVAGAAQRIGAQCRTVLSAAKLAEELQAAGGARLVIVDLNTAAITIGQIVALARAAAAGIPVVAYGPHVSEERLSAARAAGCDEVLTRGQFNAQMDAVLARHCAAK